MAATVSSFLFADLVGFTALTEAVGDERAADIAVGFCDRVCEFLPAGQAEDIKGMGDACFIRAADAGLAVELALRIVAEIGPERGLPGVRVGVHHGPAVARRGDWYGRTVNVASRVADVAGAGEVLLTDAVREAAGDRVGVEFRARGSHRLRRVGQPVLLYDAVRLEADLLQAQRRTLR